MRKLDLQALDTSYLSDYYLIISSMDKIQSKAPKGGVKMRGRDRLLLKTCILSVFLSSSVANLAHSNGSS
jgi:hypothetical protein